MTWSPNVVNFLRKVMKSWKVELICGAETLREVPINRRTFQGDALSPLLFAFTFIPLIHTLRTDNSGCDFQTEETINYLLFMDDLKLYPKSERTLYSLIQIVRIFIRDIGIQFEIDKCAMLVMEKGKIVKHDGIQLPNEK